MATTDSFHEAFREIHSRINYSEVFQASLDKLRSELNLDSVKSCLMIGPGDGQHELQFIKKFAANTTNLVAVEPDHESAEQLRAHLSRSLPAVDSQVIETNIQSWKGLDDPVDLVLMMLVLNFVHASKRKEFFKEMHEQWLARGGRVVAVYPIRTKCPGSVFQIFERLGSPFPVWEDIEADLLQSGFIKQYAHEMQVTCDMSNPNESHLRYIQRLVDQPVTLDDVRGTIQELFPDERSDQAFYTFVVYQKA